jgi:hypothetical protein
MWCTSATLTATFTPFNKSNSVLQNFELNALNSFSPVPRIGSGAATLLALLVVAAPAPAAQAQTKNSALLLDSTNDLELQGISEPGAEPVKIQAEAVSYHGRRAVRVINIEGRGARTGEQVLAIVKSSDFKDGTIEAVLAGVPRPGAPPGTRGFVGIAFRVQNHGSQFDAFYLRMTNGRADDQLRRNHATQYVSHPDFTWRRLRHEDPGQYESYVDLEAGAWTRIKIVVSEDKAELYAGGALQPCLTVNALKAKASRGQIALWVGSDTEAYFSKLTIRPDEFSGRGVHGLPQ